MENFPLTFTSLSFEQESQNEVFIGGSGSSSKDEDKSTHDTLLDFSAFESTDSGVTSATSDDADKSSSASGANGASLIDF